MKIFEGNKLVRVSATQKGAKYCSVSLCECTLEEAVAVVEKIIIHKTDPLIRGFRTSVNVREYNNKVNGRSYNRKLYGVSPSEFIDILKHYINKGEIYGDYFGDTLR